MTYTANYRRSFTANFSPQTESQTYGQLSSERSVVCHASSRPAFRNRFDLEGDKGLNTPGSAESSDGGTSSGDEEDAYEDAKESELQADIFSFLVVSFAKKGLWHQDTLRGLLLTAFGMLAQTLVGWLMLSRAISLVNGYDHDLRMASRNHKIRRGTALTPLNAICGDIVHHVETVASGYGEAFTETREWNLWGEIDNKLDLFRFQRTISYSSVFFIMCLVWTWRCTMEIRISWRAVTDFMKLPTTKNPNQEVRYEKENTEDGAGNSVILEVSVRTRYLTVVLYGLRMIVALLLMIDGWFIILMSERLMDLILNAVALEFIFMFDDYIVEALLEKHEIRSLLVESVRLRHRRVVWFLKQKFRFGGSEHRMWRLVAWLRIGILMLMNLLVMGFRHMFLRSLYQRSLILCLTGGATDGIIEADLRNVPEIIFPVQGFCESFMQSYDGQEDSYLCMEFRHEVDSEPTNALCRNRRFRPVGLFTRSDQYIWESCWEFYFGIGVEDGSMLPALKKPRDTHSDGRAVPEVFGCRREDIEVRQSRPWNGALARLFEYAEISCKRPAFGPRSSAWNSTPLTSSQYLPPNAFYADDARAPIEQQVGACNSMRSVQHCNGDPCYVFATRMRGRSCALYCADFGLSCAGAYHEKANSCDILKDIGCDQKLQGIHTSHDMLCRCALSPEKRICGAIPDAWRRCGGDPCRVLAAKKNAYSSEPFAWDNCREYCATAGLRCVNSYLVERHTCDQKVGGSLSCDSSWRATDPDWDNMVPINLCECVKD